MVKQGNDKFTISVDKAIKDHFKQLCEQYGLQPGKQIEILLKQKIEELDAKKKK
ncbi:MAG TPA: hypothetical protein VJI15_05660 [Candidatus Nanoarchaeia archaeon]|nr:hypothetical protein [Candidatus Nanoarchaeia archaeon]